MMGSAITERKPYRPNVGAILRRPEDGKILMAERIGKPGSWQFPQGGIEDGESKEEALWREINEELGLEEPETLCTILGAGPPTTYKFPKGTRMAKRWRGQRQTLFVLEFHGEDVDIHLDAFEQPEFENFAWFNVEDAHEIMWPLKRRIFTKTLEALPDIFGERA